MLWRLQKYSLQVAYKKGKEMFLADTLSRAFLPKVYSFKLVPTLEDILNASLLTLPSLHVQQIKQASAYDMC